MVKFETVNELALKITVQGQGVVFTKAGAFVSGECYGQKNYKFEKILLGPQGNPLQALVGQIGRRFTGENLPLMKVTSHGDNVTYYANEAQHVVCFHLDYGETISVESENILAFAGDCKYSVRFLAQGVISQKGLATSTLTGVGSEAYVAILVDGNPLVHSNMQDNRTIEADPDSVVCWCGADPSFKLDLSWKNLIGQASGESYMFEWDSSRRATIVVQPNERQSGIDISMDGRRTGDQASRQQNQSFGDATHSVGDTLSQLGGMLGGNGRGNNNFPPSGGGLGGLFGL